MTATFTETPAYAGTYVFTLTQTFNTCPPNPVVPLESYVVVALPGGTVSFTFQVHLETPPPPVTFAATTWTPASGHAAGQSAMTTTCPVLVQPSCTACFRLGLDITFDTTSHFTGTLTIDEELALPACPGSSLCIVRYDIEATRP